MSRVPEAPPVRAAKFATVDGTIVTGVVAGTIADGIPIPAALENVPMGRLRFLPALKPGERDRMMDVGTEERTFYVDKAGRLQALQLDRSWPPIRAAANSPMRVVSRKWRVTTEEELLEAEKARAIAAVDRRAGAGVASGLRLTHLAKEDEARRFLAGGQGESFPLLRASAEGAGFTAEREAERILLAAQASREALADSERGRLAAKKAIKEASSIEEVAKAQEAFTGAPPAKA